MDHSVVMGPPSYPYPVPLPIPSGPIPTGPIPMHPSMQPYPFFGNQNSTFVPYLTPNTFIEQQSAHYVSPIGQSGSRSNLSSKQDPKKKPSSDHQGESKTEKSEDSDDVATELELKTPGSMTDQVSVAFVFSFFQDGLIRSVTCTVFGSQSFSYFLTLLS